MRPLLLLAFLFPLLSAADQADQFANLKAKATKAQHDYFLAMMAVGVAAASMHPKATGAVALDSGNNRTLNGIHLLVSNVQDRIKGGTREIDVQADLLALYGEILKLGVEGAVNSDGAPMSIKLDH